VAYWKPSSVSRCCSDQAIALVERLVVRINRWNAVFAGMFYSHACTKKILKPEY
jgi:hypothetical protein